MDNQLQALCEAVKKLALHLRAPQQTLSFILCTGKLEQGKTTVLRQAQLMQQPLEEVHSASLFYNQQGIVLELGEAWLNDSDNILTYTFRQLNRCCRGLKITGIILTVDVGELLQTDPVQLQNECTSHLHLLQRIYQALNNTIPIALMLTKLDKLAGFCEFFQSEHQQELGKPLGFSLDISLQRAKQIENYRQQFDKMIELLGQQIINKLHPARSSIQRTLIREFPLQIASLRIPVQTLLQLFIVQKCPVQAIYFTSAEQGGMSIDKLNQKIQHEYALTIPDKYPQAHNYRAYFIEGAVKAFLDQCKSTPLSIQFQYKLLLSSACAAVLLGLAILGYQHWQTSNLLDEASKELLAYESMSQSHDLTAAIYHLSQAENKLNLIPRTFITHPTLEELKTQLHYNTQQKLQQNFLPELLGTLEQTISSATETPLSRYQALKIYLMLGDPEHFSEPSIIDWFSHHWQMNHAVYLNDQQILLLRNALKQPFQGLALNTQLISDTRNYLNALPATYLYYSLAKAQFPAEKTYFSLTGFELASKEIPLYMTKAGFQAVIQQLPRISQQLQQENWVLARQDLDTLQLQLEQAYCFDYTTWWQNFIRHTRPQHYQSYQQARNLLQSMSQANALNRLIQFIQQETSPESQDNSGLFNQKIASQFTTINLMTASATQELSNNVHELENFLSTLSLVNDQGKTVFELTKSRFQGHTLSDPLSSLYNRAHQLPEPMATWAKQIADDTWFIFINDSKTYLNKQWQKLVYLPYKNNIAHRYPLDPNEKEEINLQEFDQFFAPRGVLNQFVSNYLKPFLDTSQAQWQAKEVDGYVLPISTDLINELIRANVIANMFFPDSSATSHIDFSLQKINLDPVVSSLELTIGETTMNDNQTTESDTQFTWPDRGAKLRLNSIEGNHYELEETGTWAFFKMLQKVNVFVDSNDSSSLQILFEVNGNSGRYLLKTQNQINPFSPGILTGFVLNKAIV